MKVVLNECGGGVCSPLGFRAGGINCGIRKNKNKKDLALIVSDVPCSAAGVFTRNLVKGAPVVLSKEHIGNGVCQAIICNSGNANTCNADGAEIAQKMCDIVEEITGIDSNDVIVASTGVIGQKLDISPMIESRSALFDSLSYQNSRDAAEAIMTTDTVSKEVAVQFNLGDAVCHIGGIAKGVGMVCPNMATNLIFLTSDVSITPEMLQRALSSDVRNSFNMMSVDGDQSTNDTCCILANGLAGNAIIDKTGFFYNTFCKALNFVNVKLSKMLAKDGEGATKLVTCNVKGAKTKKNARNIAKSVIKSSLVKAAMFGADANWGRVICAIGYSGENVNIGKIDISFSSANGSVVVCKSGYGVEFSEETAKSVLSSDEVTIEVNLNSGFCGAEAWGCDLTYDYVKINGDYRT